MGCEWSDKAKIENEIHNRVQKVKESECFLKPLYDSKHIFGFSKHKPNSVRNYGFLHALISVKMYNFGTILENLSQNICKTMPVRCH